MGVAEPQEQMNSSNSASPGGAIGFKGGVAEPHNQMTAPTVLTSASSKGAIGFLSGDAEPHNLLPDARTSLRGAIGN